MLNQCVPEVFTLSGVASGANGPIAGIAIRYSFDCVTSSVVTNELGEYFIRVPDCTGVLIVPDAGSGYTVSPARYVFSPVCEDQLRLDFTLTPVVSPPAEVTLTGSITGLPVLSGVIIRYTVDGVAGSTVTGATGAYSITAPMGSTVVITPEARAGTVVTPASRTFSNVIINTTVPVYSYATVLSVSGTVTIDDEPANGVTINYTANGITKSTVTGASGTYSVYVPTGSDVTITPLANGYTSVPPYIALTNVVAATPSQDFALTPSAGYALVTGTLSGLRSASGLGVTYSINGGTPHTALTNIARTFAFAAPLNASVTVVPPTQVGYAPAPANTTIPMITDPVNIVDFVYD